MDYGLLRRTLICYTVAKIWHVTDVIAIFYFGLFFALLPPPLPYHPKKSKFKKKKKEKKKMPGDIIILHVCTKTYDQMMYSSGDTVRDGETDGRMNRTEEQTDRQKK